jgi:hypothetical protein
MFNEKIIKICNRFLIIHSKLTLPHHKKMTKQKTFIPPFRVGRKQKRAVLDSQGREVVIFPVGMEDYANEYVDFLNKKHKTND